jgi:hypothetical protein
MESVKSISVRYAVDKTHSEDKVVANLSYLTQGLMWAPSYMLRQDKKNKTMTLQGNACLLCDLPFFKGNSIDSVALVAGQPKMECRNISDPLASGATAAQFMSMLERNGNAQTGESRYHKLAKRSHMQMYSEGINCMASRSYDDDFESAEGVAAGEKMDDLYFYKLRNVPLHYNRPMSLPFIEECSPVPYQDVYFFDLNTKGGAGGKDDTAVEATHAITFKNTSAQPFTTGPVSVLMAKGSTYDLDDMDFDAPKKNKGNNFLVQGLIRSTGPNKTATVELTKALDVEGKFVVENSKDQKVEANKKIKEDEYELRSVQTTGTLTITNLKNEEVKCKVDHLLRGHLDTSDPTHVEVTETQTGHHDLNPTAKYVWEIKVPAKGKAELVFKYCIKQWIKANEEPLKTLTFGNMY